MRNNIVALFVAAALAQAAAAQEADTSGADALEQVVVTGTRVANRSVLDTAVPVDVVSNEALSNLGVTEINQALSVALPSFSASAQDRLIGYADGDARRLLNAFVARAYRRPPAAGEADRFIALAPVNQFFGLV